MLAPGGSARDLFLHVRPTARAHGGDRGSSRCWASRADVHLTERLLADGVFGPRPFGRGCASGSANVLVLPRAGESVWWYERGRYEQRFRGHHGGASADEM